MPTVIHILARTPPWVFVAAAYLLWQGVQSLRPRTQPFWGMLLAPGLFIAFGVSRIVGAAGGRLDGLEPWAAGFVVWLPVAFMTGPRLTAVDRSRGLVTRPGSPAPLIRNLVAFSLQYAAAAATAGHLASSSLAASVAHGISGSTAGYFVGWVIVAVRHYRAAPGGPPGGLIPDQGLLS